MRQAVCGLRVLGKNSLALNQINFLKPNMTELMPFGFHGAVFLRDNLPMIND